MATMNSVIEYIDRVKPNVYSDDDKYRWISTLEGRISTEVFGQWAPITYTLPDDADTELMLMAPFDDIYALYVAAMIDFHNREYSDYNNTVLMFQERMDALKAWYIRNHRQCEARNFRNVMG